MFDPKKLLNDLLGSRVPGTESTVREKAGQVTQLAKDNPIATTALAAVLLGTGAGRAVTGTALKLGGLAAVTGLAYTAYKNYQAGNKPGEGGGVEILPPPADTAFDPGQAPQGEDDFALTLVRAMIAAARADGRIDDDERKHIGDKLKLSGFDGEAEAFLVAEMEKPIDPDTRAERGYLDQLAGRLGLPDALVDHVEATIANVTR